MGLAVAACLEVVAARASHSLGIEMWQRFDFAAGVLLVIAAAVTLFRWRIEGLAFECWTSLGLVALALPELARGSTPHLLAVAVGATGVAAYLFAVSARAPDVDTKLSNAGAVLALIVAVTLAVIIAIPVDALRIQRLGSAVVAVAVAVVAWSTSKRARGQSWLVAVLIATSLAATAAAVLPTAMLTASGAPLIHFAAGVAAVLGTAGALQSTARTHRAAAFVAECERARSDAHAHAVEAEHAETLHEVRTTVLTLEGGVRSLRPAAQASTTPDAALADALLAELDRLRGLVEPSRSSTSEFALRDALEPLLTISATGGPRLDWDIPGDVYAVGRVHDVAEIINELLTNARRYAATSAVDVRATIDDAFVLVSVEDRGPGVPRGKRELIFEPGTSGDEGKSPTHQGLGLHIARRLARDLGGDLWVEQRRPWGARFVLSLPVATRATPDALPEPERRSAS